MKTQISRITLVSALLACFATSASALPTAGRRLSGTIRNVETRVREAEMRRADNDAVIAFRWNKHTLFVANGKIADPAIVRTGANVNVIYHEPFFGKPFVSRVKLAMPISHDKSSK
jgi:hypothetical protein